MHPVTAFVLLWLAWLVTWLAAAPWSNRTEKRAGIGIELRYRALLLLGAVVFMVPAHNYRGELRLWLLTLSEAWACVALVGVGLLFAWWARIHLGRLWSASVTKKADHRVIDTGPYAIVRHPIYSGLLLAIYATAAAKGTVLGLIGMVLITAGLWLKAHYEENWLAAELAAGAYAAYRSRVPMLLPFGPKG